MFSFSLNAQNIIFLENDTKEPIPYATIKYFENSTFSHGDYSSEAGIVDLQKKINFDYIEISCIGYETKKIYKSELSDGAIYLYRKINLLNEVIVPRNKHNTEIIGYLNRKKSNKTEEIVKGYSNAVLIKNIGKQDKLIKSIIFCIKKPKYDVDFRLQLFKVNNKIFPGEELLPQNFICKIKSGDKESIEVDISKFNISLPENGIFVSIEGLEGINAMDTYLNGDKENKKSKKVYIITTQSNEEVFFSKNVLGVAGWINMNKWLPEVYRKSFKKEIQDSELTVPQIGIRVME
jgi:hypothetical protein